MMNEYLAQAYGTAQPIASQQEDAEKIAEAQLFCKLAADANIDLSQLPDEKVAEMYEAYKTAADEEKKDEEGHETTAAAAAQFDQIKEAQAKLAEADFIGRTIAHAYVDELKKIAAGTQAGIGADEGKTLPFMPKPKVEDAKTQVYRGRPHDAPPLRAQHGTKMMSDKKTVAGGFGIGHDGKPIKPSMTQAMKAEGEAASTGTKLKDLGRKILNKGEEVASRVGNYARQHPGRAAAIAAGTLAAGTAAGAAAHHFASSGDGKKKKASALTELAAEVAVYKAAEAGFDPEEAGELLDAALTLGVSDEGSKMAAAETLDQAAEIRALELLEAVGYPVNW